MTNTIVAWHAATFEFAADWWCCAAAALEARLRALVERERRDDLVAVEWLGTAARSGARASARGCYTGHLAYHEFP